MVAGEKFTFTHAKDTKNCCKIISFVIYHGGMVEEGLIHSTDIQPPCIVAFQLSDLGGQDKTTKNN